MTIGPDEVDSAAAAASLLYGLAAESFVSARDELVKALRAGGRRDLATEVKALRRPSVIAAELNRALRHGPGARETLIEAARVLAQGHHQLLAGEPVDLAGLQRSHRAAVAAVASHAAAHQAEVHAALEAASLDESLHAQLRTATFAVEPAPARGFDLLSLAAVPPRPRPAPDASPDRSAAHRADRRLRSVPDPEPTPQPDTGPPPDPEHRPPVPERLESEHGPGAGLRAEPVEAVLRDRVAAQRLAAEAGLARAERRAAATGVARDKAAGRVAELEARLAEARSHHLEAIHRAEAAEAALGRARSDLDRSR